MAAWAKARAAIFFALFFREFHSKAADFAALTRQSFPPCGNCCRASAPHGQFLPGQDFRRSAQSMFKRFLLGRGTRIASSCSGRTAFAPRAKCS